MRGILFIIGLSVGLAVVSVASGGSPSTNADCGTQDVDLRAPGKSMHGMPIRDQGAGPLCAFYVASQMIQAKTKGKVSPHPYILASEYTGSGVSRDPIDVALAEGGPFNPFREGGVVCDVVSEVAARKNVCVLDSRDWENTGNWQNQIEDLSKWFSDHTRNSKRSDLLEVQKELCEIERGSKYFFLKVKRDVVPAQNVLAHVLKEKDEREFIQEMLFHECEKSNKRIDTHIPACASYFGSNSGEKSKVVHQLLEQNNAQPVYLSICQNLITALEPAPASPSCGRHSVLVVGKKKTQNGCQFLIRNSWGADCDSVSRTLDCKRGEIWVDHQQLMDYTYRIGSLDHLTR